MALLLTHAILHSVGNNPGQCRYSDVELDVDSETCIEFVGKHARRLLRNPGAREAAFTAQSGMYALVKAFQKGELHFKEMSRQICERLAGIMDGNDDIPPADILVTAFDNAGKTYLAVIKLNYGECFTHKLTGGDNGAVENRIIKNTVVLPLSANKVEEACLIPCDPMVLRILEKTHSVGGENVNYFSKLFLECETEISKKEAAEAIREIVNEINAKYFNGNVEMAARMNVALIHEAEDIKEDDGLVLENVARRAFDDNNEAKTEFAALVKEYGLPHQVMLDRAFIQREFKVQRFHADNGVEIKCPSELFDDPAQVQLTTNPDGSVTITLKNLRPKESSL